MSAQQTRTCKSCRQQNQQDATFCSQCGADLAPFDRRAFIIALGLTAAPLVAASILTFSSIDPGEASLAFGFPYIAATLFIAFLMVVCSVVAAIVGAVLRRRKRSALGVLVGLGVGLMLGAASCTASFAAFS